MKKSTIALAIISGLTAAPAFAADADWTVTGNVNVLTDYRFRGISQTGRGPALQGGFDAGHKSGFYVGNWNSNVSGTQYPGGHGIEMDFYAGYKGEYKGVGYDIGNLYYYYGDARFGNTKVDNNEVYGALSYGPVSAKVSYATTDYFGLNGDTAVLDENGAAFGSGNSRGTTYSELNFSKEIMPKLTLAAHVGYTDIKNYKDFSYTDYKLGLSYDLNGYVLGAAYVGNDVKARAKGPFFTSATATGPKELYTDTIVLSIGKTF
jgi:uncharacterized protein (TIGR02001 family)